MEINRNLTEDQRTRMLRWVRSLLNGDYVQTANTLLRQFWGAPELAPPTGLMACCLGIVEHQNSPQPFRLDDGRGTLALVLPNEVPVVHYNADRNDGADHTFPERTVRNMPRAEVCDLVGLRYEDAARYAHMNDEQYTFPQIARTVVREYGLWELRSEFPSLEPTEAFVIAQGLYQDVHPTFALDHDRAIRVFSDAEHAWLARRLGEFVLQLSGGVNIDRFMREFNTVSWGV